MIARNVCTKRDLTTFSRPVCELSGSMAENGTGAVDDDVPENIDVENDGPVKSELTEDGMELVRGRCTGLTVGAEPLVE